MPDKVCCAESVKRVSVLGSSKNVQTACSPQVHETNNLTVFISWENRDLGIETCFVDGTDALH